MFFSNIIGHKSQLEQVREDLFSENMSHAYLLAGPSDIGKYTIAKAMAKTLQTVGKLKKDINNIAVQIEKEYHPDVLILRKGKESSNIKVEEMRPLLANLNLTGNSDFRIFLIEEIERLTAEAANAMLKILEEPPRNVLFIFTSNKPDQILETILSRVRRIDFKKVPEYIAREGLKKRYYLEKATALDQVIALSGGRIGLAIRLLENTKVLEVYSNTYNEIESFLTERNISKGMSFIGQIYDDAVLTEIFINVVMIILRKSLIEAANHNKIEEQESLVKQLDFVLKLSRQLETNVNSRLMLENLLLQL